MTASLAAATAAGLSATLAPASASGLHFRRRAIPDGHLVPDFHEPGRNGAAHGTQSRDSDLHTVLS